MKQKMIWNLISVVFLGCITYSSDNLQDDNFMQDIMIPFEIELSLSFLKDEILEYKNSLRYNWHGLQAQKVIQKAEQIVANNPDKFSKDIENKIIELFENINITIAFTDDNKIIRTDKSHSDIDNNTESEKLHHLLKEKLDEEEKKIHTHHLKTTQKTDFKDTGHKRVHGARRSMKKLQKYREEQEKKEHERHKELLEAIHKHVEKDLENKAEEKLKKTSSLSKHTHDQDYDEQDHDKNDSHIDQHAKPAHFIIQAEQHVQKNIPHFQNRHTQKNIPSTMHNQHPEEDKPFEASRNTRNFEITGSLN